MKVRKRLKYSIPFIALTILCGTSHEFAHHFAGAMICGCFGFKTFNSFELCQGCMEANPYWIVATVVGPLFTFFLLWLGLYQLRKVDVKQKQLGFALIFANFPVNRLLFAFMGFNDEQFVTATLFGKDNQVAFWVTNIIVCLFTIPPLYAAYRAIDQKGRILWFLGYFILPFVFVIVFAGFLLEEWLLLEQQFLADPIIGIPLLILVVETVSLLVYYLFKKNLHQNALVKLK